MVENLAEFSVQGSGKTLIALAAFRIWQHQGLLKKMLRVIGPQVVENHGKMKFKGGWARCPYFDGQDPRYNERG